MRKAIFVAFLVGLSVLWLRPRRSESVATSFVFPLSLSGKVWTTNLGFGPGIKVRPGPVNDKIMGAILRGENTDDFSKDFLDIMHADPSGRFFVYFDGRNLDGSTTWRVATNPNGVMTTSLTGTITQDGFFWLTGTYTLPMVGDVATAFVNGRVTFAKNTFNPTKIAGVINFETASFGQAFTLKFKTVAKPTVVM